MQRRVSWDGQDVHLTPIEYRLLTVLVRSAGKLLTHAQLLREVWGPGYAERGHYLRIYMGHLRQKLERDPARPAHIVTETGIGYRLVSNIEPRRPSQAKALASSSPSLHPRGAQQRDKTPRNKTLNTATTGRASVGEQGDQ